ncbi:MULTISPECIES: LacI family DNA-binding transcriptional regulator [unclassified Sporosarcina]|uniref:LacI family DNA-binding transcriptional regulator n=1 Tax=unclassified Sporosarcina TaxID=2647733 RepID=UPI00203CECA7|nr:MULTISPECIES: LacI family DNA-binding transcriptional regulator [unclassified Sporosarcina]GKV65865.1 HTH-type transcriptional regulator DegA [Sporosarcina sp. NCCP-2331]GLB55990.1 HTH-type transcriptional regulator DegA [Sporosarcina sp. NCCP-2378]
MKVTIYDVAKEANVSIATVSKVINNTGRISEKTRHRVKNIMEELDYRPNLIASALMGKQTKTIGLLIPDLVNPFFAELARSIEDRGHLMDYNLVICNTDYDPEKEDNYLSLLKQKQVDGFILASGFESLDKVEQLMKADVPVVIVARDFPMFSVDAVAIDDFMGGYLAAQHLTELGHERIGVVARNLYSNRERLRGFNFALEEKGLEPQLDYVYTDEIDNILAGRKMVDFYASNDQMPTAIFACNDLLASGVIQRAKEMGLSIPDDLSVVGFDNTSIVSIIEPPLTTIAQPIQSMGKEVMDLMISIIKGEREEKGRITLLPNLVVRNSTKEINKQISKTIDFSEPSY